MDNEMIERVAESIAQADEQNGGLPYAARLAFGKHAKEHLFDQAKAAIKAMREPTGKMKTIVTEDMVITDNCYYCGGHIDGWRTMIDSILND